jgi:hypothetical protein
VVMGLVDRLVFMSFVDGRVFMGSLMGFVHGSHERRRPARWLRRDGVGYGGVRRDGVGYGGLRRDGVGYGGVEVEWCKARLLPRTMASCEIAGGRMVAAHIGTHERYARDRQRE